MNVLNTPNPAWRESFGAWNMPMPHGKPLVPVQDWFSIYLLDNKEVAREDWEDRYRIGHFWGPDGVGNQGGSMLRYGHERDAVDEVVVADHCLWNRYNAGNGFDGEHHLRQIGDAITAFEFFGDRTSRLHLLKYAADKGFEMGPTNSKGEPNPTHGGADWTPNNINQLLTMAHVSQHTGFPGTDSLQSPPNLREWGHVLLGEAMALKADPLRSQRFARMALQAFELAAVPFTGQIVYDWNTGGEPIDQKSQYTMHWSMLALGVVGCCVRMGEPIPQWIFDGVKEYYLSPIVDYAGGLSRYAFMYSEDGMYVPATGPGQQPDPACGWMEELLAVLYWQTRDRTFLQYTLTYGMAATSLSGKKALLNNLTDPQALRSTILLRGVLERI